MAVPTKTTAKNINSTAAPTRKPIAMSPKTKPTSGHHNSLLDFGVAYGLMFIMLSFVSLAILTKWVSNNLERTKVIKYNFIERLILLTIIISTFLTTSLVHTKSAYHFAVFALFTGLIISYKRGESSQHL